MLMVQFGLKVRQLGFLMVHFGACLDVAPYLYHLHTQGVHMVHFGAQKTEKGLA